ncbi:Hypothetical predicted protein [Octopus vulgaris]|uniref:Uncharacterized protein n=1 Tax=Octopus vulgaris TaxID=6645 RepID=A0AA36AM32_OCTVU|nr:Hypothetical predicted protein [Octopus vulgaris]
MIPSKVQKTASRKIISKPSLEDIIPHKVRKKASFKTITKIVSEKQGCNLWINNQIDLRKIYLTNFLCELFAMRDNVSDSEFHKKALVKIKSVIRGIASWNYTSLPKTICYLKKLSKIHHGSNPPFQMLHHKVKFRPLQKITTHFVNFNLLSEQLSFINITKILMLYDVAVIYDSYSLSINYINQDGLCETYYFNSPITDMTQVGEHTVMGSLPFRNKIILIHPFSLELITLDHGFYKLSYVEGTKFVGVKLFSKTIYLVDWIQRDIHALFNINHFISSIAVGPRKLILVAFSIIPCVTCYNLQGRKLFQFDVPFNDKLIEIVANQKYFYFFENNNIFKVSEFGGISKRIVERTPQKIYLHQNNLVLFSNFKYQIITPNFWPRQTYFSHNQSPRYLTSLDIENARDIRAVIPISRHCFIIIYLENFIKLLILRDEKKIIEHSLTLESPLIDVSRWAEDKIIVSFGRKFQKISWDNYNLVATNIQATASEIYIQISHIISDKFVCLVDGHKAQLHIICVTESKIEPIEFINLEHGNVSIAASPLNLMVVDKMDEKLVVFSTDGEQLFQIQLPVIEQPRKVYSDILYFYIISNNNSIKIYNIFGQLKREWKIPRHFLPVIGVQKGTVTIVDPINSILHCYKFLCGDGYQVPVKTLKDTTSTDIIYDDQNQIKAIIGSVCLVPNGQLAIAEWGENKLLLCCKKGNINHQLSVPSPITDICRWDCNNLGLTLPLEKQLWIFDYVSNYIRVRSFEQPYVLIHKLDNDRAICYCDKSKCLDIVTIKLTSQQPTRRLAICPSYIRSLHLWHNNILALTKSQLLKYNTSFCGSPTILYPKFGSGRCLYDVCSDKTAIYLIDDSQMLSFNEETLMVCDYVSCQQLKSFIDQLDIFSCTAVVTDTLSSVVHRHDISMTLNKHVYQVPHTYKDTKRIIISALLITDNNLIVICDKNNCSIKILTFKGELIDTLDLNSSPTGICRCLSNSFAISTNTDKLLTVQVQFPLTYVSFKTCKNYRCIASFSDGRLVCSWTDNGSCGLSIVDLKSSVFMEKHINGWNEIRRKTIHDMTVTPNDEIVVHCYDEDDTFSEVIFLNIHGQITKQVTPLNMSMPISITSDKLYIYIITSQPIDYYYRVTRLSMDGKYHSMFLHPHELIDESVLTAMNCRGPRFVMVNSSNNLYTEGLLSLNREIFSVSHLQCDNFPVQVKDFDVSERGQIVIYDRKNDIVKCFRSGGLFLCHKKINFIVGGLCFIETGNILITVPQIREIHELSKNTLSVKRVFNTEIPYCKIYRKIHNHYWCQDLESTECHLVKIENNNTIVIIQKILLIQHPEYQFWFNSEEEKNRFNQERKLRNSPDLYIQAIKRSRNCNKRLLKQAGDYIASCREGSNIVAVRKLPRRKEIVCIPHSVDKTLETSHYGAHFLLLDNNKMVVSYNDNVIVVRTKETAMETSENLHKFKTDAEVSNLCQWKQESLVFCLPSEKQFVFYNSDFSLQERICTDKSYEYIGKTSNNCLVCCRGGGVNRLGSSEIYSGACIDILLIEDSTYVYKSQNDITDGIIYDIAVMLAGDVVVSGEFQGKDSVCWFNHDIIKIIVVPVIGNPKRITAFGQYAYYFDWYGIIYRVSIDGYCERYITTDNREIITVHDLHAADFSLILFGQFVEGDSAICFYQI